MGSNVSYIKKDVFINKYSVIKKVIIEEAANGGFASLTGEIKPSQYNNWTGQLYFSLKTPNGTDQFYAKFEKMLQGDKVQLFMHGSGTRTNPDSAIKAINGRLRAMGIKMTDNP